VVVVVVMRGVVAVVTSDSTTALDSSSGGAVAGGHEASMSSAFAQATLSEEVAGFDMVQEMEKVAAKSGGRGHGGGERSSVLHTHIRTLVGVLCDRNS